MKARSGAVAPTVFDRSRVDQWTRERIEALPAQEVKQLRANAERLDVPELAALCSEVLGAQPRSRKESSTGHGPRTTARHLVSRIKAFEASGVWLHDARTSWGGTRSSDGAVVMALWADSIEYADGKCSYLLWAPNVEGSRPWSDTVAGQERREHCKRAIKLGHAEGLLVYGQRLEGQIPEDRARSVYGVDMETVVRFTVELRSAEYWAVWGSKLAASPLNASPGA